MRRHPASVRVRATAGAVVVAAVVLLAAGALLTVTLQRAQLASIDQGLELRAIDIESLLDGGSAPATVAVESEDASFVQIVAADGVVVASSDNMIGERVASVAPGHSTVAIEPLDAQEFRTLRWRTDGGQGLDIVVGTSLDGLEEIQRTLRISLSVGLPAVLLLLAALTWVVVGTALRPVDAIRRRVDAIGVGQLDQRVPVPLRRDEIGRLASTMNRMLARLEDANRRQSRFVSDAAHELRTPLTIVRHELEVVLESDGSDWRSAAEGALAENLRMERLVDDLLFIARHEHGSSEITDSAQLVDLDDIVMTEARRVHGAVTIDVSDVSAGQVRGHAEQLARVIRNLIDNALRHAQSAVAVSVRSRDGEVLVEVEDDGAGIPVDDRDLVFERFVRLDEARSRDAGGSGLGLSIARDIVLAHGGTIVVSPLGRLGGAHITVTLPDARA